MKAILLAAGLGTRLRPLTDTLPKCLVPICGRPLLELWLENLARAAIGPVLVNTHHLADEVSRYIDGSPYRDAVTLIHEPRLLGTGSTLLANRDFFGQSPVLLAHADNLCVCDLGAFVRAHQGRTAGALMTMMTFSTDAPSTCGIVEVDDRDIVSSVHEKVPNPPGHLANGAVYIVEPEIVDFMAALPGTSIDFSTDVVPRLRGRIQTWHNPGIHRDIGTLASLQLAQSEVRSQIADRGVHESVFDR